MPRYDLVDGRRLARSRRPVLWWCPNRRSSARFKVYSVLPPPPVDATAPLRTQSHCWTHTPRQDPRTETNP